MIDSHDLSAVIGGLLVVLLSWLAALVRQNSKDWKEAAVTLSIRITALTDKFENLLATDHVRRSEFDRRGLEIEDICRRQMAVTTRLDNIEREILEFRRNLYSGRSREQDGG